MSQHRLGHANLLCAFQSHSHGDPGAHGLIDTPLYVYICVYFACVLEPHLVVRTKTFFHISRTQEVLMMQLVLNCIIVLSQHSGQRDVDSFLVSKAFFVISAS